MNAFAVYALICSALATPSPIDCRPGKSLDVIKLADAPNEVQCGKQAQETMASLAGIPIRPGEYLKIVCTRSQKGNVG